MCACPPHHHPNTQFVDSVSGKRFETIDPRNEEVITTVAEGDAKDVDLAVKAARKAFETGPWPKMSGRERGRIMFRLADLIEKHADELAALESLDNGKPISMAKAADVPLTIDHTRYFAGWADKIQGKVIKTPQIYLPTYLPACLPKSPHPSKLVLNRQFYVRTHTHNRQSLLMEDALHTPYMSLWVS